MSLQDKHLEHIAKVQAFSDFSWHSWNSPIGLSVFLFVSSASLICIALTILLLRYAWVLH